MGDYNEDAKGWIINGVNPYGYSYSSADRNYYYIDPITNAPDSNTAQNYGGQVYDAYKYGDSYYTKGASYADLYYNNGQ